MVADIRKSMPLNSPRLDAERDPRLIGELLRRAAKEGA